MKVVPFPSQSANGSTPLSPVRSTIAALDIGTTKICCLIGQVHNSRRRSVDQSIQGITVIGSGHCRAEGVRNGAIVDLNAAEKSIRVAIEQAERMSGQTITEVYVNLSGGRTSSVHVSGEAHISAGQVTEADKRRAMIAAMSQVDSDGLAVVHASVYGYRLDGVRGVQEPDGMHGSTLTADMNVVVVDPNIVSNLGLLLERCHIDAAGFVVAPYAAARSVLLQDEMELGVALVDIGGGTTSYAVFNEGALAHAGQVPVGSHHVTTDIARGLNTTIAHAERVKTLWGSAVASQQDDRELITCPILGEAGSDAVNRFPRSMVCGVIQPRMEEVFEIVRSQLDQIPEARHVVRRVVLTGGGSQLNGIEQLASEVLGCSIRIAKPTRFEGLADTLKTPGFCVASGLLRYGLSPDRQAGNLGVLVAGAGHDTSYFRRVGRWIKESF